MDTFYGANLNRKSNIPIKIKITIKTIIKRKNRPPNKLQKLQINSHNTPNNSSFKTILKIFKINKSSLKSPMSNININNKQLHNSQSIRNLSTLSFMIPSLLSSIKNKTYTSKPSIQSTSNSNPKK
jgi:uncharacterized protein YaaR (DUF327 family)